MEKRRRVIIYLFLSLAFLASHAYSETDCIVGAYGDGRKNTIVLTEKSWVAKPHLGYLTLHGQFGSTLDADKPFECFGDFLIFKAQGSLNLKLKRIDFTSTEITFSSSNTNLAGQLIERTDLAVPNSVLLVMVHGSEREAAIGSARSLLLASTGIRVFVYDKRGTGKSDGLYTQNFELLADDAVVAMQSARKIAKDRYQRSGYYGVSQGGWVAPLAGIRAEADFIAVGFGLINSLIEEDLDQMMQEAHQLGLNDKSIKQVINLSKITAMVVNSHFNAGFKQLDHFREAVSDQPWTKLIKGEYSGEILRMSNQDLIRVGRAVFDNLELIWDYDAESVIRQVKVPLLWVLAQNDREAPIERTRSALINLKNKQVPIEGFVFPNTDHGMYEYVENSDGSRRITRVTDGYFELISSWIKGTALTNKARYLKLDDDTIDNRKY